MATSCKLRGGRGILWDVLKIDGSLAGNIDFQVASCGVHKKFRRKTSILKLHNVKIGGSLAWNALFDAPTCLVSGLRFSSGLAVSMGEAANLPCFTVRANCNVVLRGRRGTSWHSHSSANVSKIMLCRRCNKLASFSEDEVHYTPHFTLLHFRLDILHSALYTAHFTLYTSHSTLYTPRFAVDTSHFTLYTWHSTLRILNTLYLTFYTPQSTLSTSSFTLGTPLCACDTVRLTCAFWVVEAWLWRSAVHMVSVVLPPCESGIEKNQSWSILINIIVSFNIGSSGRFLFSWHLHRFRLFSWYLQRFRLLATSAVSAGPHSWFDVRWVSLWHCFMHVVCTDVSVQWCSNGCCRFTVAVVYCHPS